MKRCLLYLVIVTITVGRVPKSMCQIEEWSERCDPNCEPDMWIKCTLDYDDSCTNFETVQWNLHNTWERTYSFGADGWTWKWRKREKWRPSTTTERVCGVRRRVTKCYCVR